MAARRGLTDEQLSELLSLIKGSDTVELKLTVPASGQRSAVAALQMDPLRARIRQVFFFDTPDLSLFKAGVVVRARRAQKKANDSVVKLRPVVPDNLPSALRKLPSFGVEVDAMPGGFVCSATMKSELKGDPVREAALGERPVKKLFDKEQRAFYAKHAPDGLGIEGLSVLGPIFVLKLKWTPRGYAGRMVAEVWLYPDGSRVLELSTKCAPADTFTVAADTRAFLSERGIDLEGRQETKTRKALNFFAKELQPA